MRPLILWSSQRTVQSPQYSSLAKLRCSMWLRKVRAPTALETASWSRFRQRGVLPATSQEWEVSDSPVQVHMNGIQWPLQGTAPSKTVGLAGRVSIHWRIKCTQLRFKPSVAKTGGRKAQSFLPASTNMRFTCHEISSSAQTPFWFDNTAIRASTENCEPNNAINPRSVSILGGKTPTN